MVAEHMGRVFVVSILGVALLGAFLSESSAAETQKECQNIVRCFVDPCEVHTCLAHPDATCIANYCGGCHAIFLDASGNRLHDCIEQADQTEDSEVPQCEGDQVFNRCGSSCSKVKTCSDPNPKTDDVCTEECVGQCECPADRPIWRNGQCITEDQCKTDPIQECKSNLVWNDCGSACTRPWRTCSDKDNSEAFSIATKDSSETLMCPDVCQPRCECPKTAPFLHNFICIPESACPQKPDECTRWAKCPINPCEQHQCSSNPGAGCRPNYCGGCLANFFTEVDALIDSCSASKETCSGGQEWNECGSACVSTCNDPNPMCTKECVPRCQCPADRPVWKEGQCVAVTECDSRQCKSNMVFTECGSACTPNCRDPNPVCTEQCVARCQCPRDLPIFHLGVCTTEEACPEEPEPECKGGMEFQECGSRCAATCTDPNPVCTFECVRGCHCPSDAPILHNGECIPQTECPEVKECEGGQVWKTCGMSCTLTCDDPRPLCSKECVEKCQCPYSKPIWHEGQCIPLDRCPEKPKEKCVHNGREYGDGESWSPDPCTTCTCEVDEETGKKSEFCAQIACAYPDCETEVYVPKDQCCPICADACSHGEDATYEVGERWSPDPCTTCHCVRTANGEKEEICNKIYCDIPRCDTELVWNKNSCCPHCADECTYNGKTYEVGDFWKPNDCTSCQCHMENGQKKQICATAMCAPPSPDCEAYQVRGECCPRCKEACTSYNMETGRRETYDVGETWSPDPCTECSCVENRETGKVEEICSIMDCAREDCATGEWITVDGSCCPVCLKPCYSVDKSGQLTLHKPNEEWKKSPCETCRCVPDEDTVYRNECFEIMCDIPICGPFSELVYDPESCCPYCSEECVFNGKRYEIGDTWKPELCATCSCVEEREGQRKQICRMESCAAPAEGCELVYSKDSCCPKCQEQCEMYVGGETRIFQPGDEWQPDQCTFCSCILDDAEKKLQICAIMDCAALEDSCVPVYNPGECCPVCEGPPTCDLSPHIEHGSAVSKSGAGQDASYTFQCDQGYWFKKESQHTAFCNKLGETVYPECEKLSIKTRLVDLAPGKYLLEMSSSAGGGYGLLCDDGWSDREAALICQQHGYNFGRAVSLESDREDFLFTQLSCPRENDVLLQHCSVTRYSEAKLNCQYNEVAGLFCYNSAFEYRIKDNIGASWSKRAISLYFEVSGLKYGKPVDLKRGTFRLNPVNFSVTTEKSTSNATKARIKYKDGVATVRMKLKKPQNFEDSDCITLKIRGPSNEYDYQTEVCNN